MPVNTDILIYSNFITSPTGHLQRDAKFWHIQGGHQFKQSELEGHAINGFALACQSSKTGPDFETQPRTLPLMKIGAQNQSSGVILAVREFLCTALSCVVSVKRNYKSGSAFQNLIWKNTFQLLLLFLSMAHPMVNRPRFSHRRNICESIRDQSWNARFMKSWIPTPLVVAQNFLNFIPFIQQHHAHHQLTGLFCAGAE